MKIFRKSKVSTIKNLKIELKALKSFKKSLLERFNGYKNKIELVEDEKIYSDALLENNFDIINICRVVIEEKNVNYFI